MLNFIYNLNTEIFKHIFKIFCVVIIEYKLFLDVLVIRNSTNNLESDVLRTDNHSHKQHMMTKLHFLIHENILFSLEKCIIWQIFVSNGFLKYLIDNIIKMENLTLRNEISTFRIETRQIKLGNPGDKFQSFENSRTYELNW